MLTVPGVSQCSRREGLQRAAQAAQDGHRLRPRRVQLSDGFVFFFASSTTRLACRPDLCSSFKVAAARPRAWWWPAWASLTATPSFSRRPCNRPHPPSSHPLHNSYISPHAHAHRELPSHLELEAQHETVPAALRGHARRSSFTPLKKELGISYHNGDYKVSAHLVRPLMSPVNLANRPRHPTDHPASDPRVQQRRRDQEAHGCGDRRLLRHAESAPRHQGIQGQDRGSSVASPALPSCARVRVCVRVGVRSDMGTSIATVSTVIRRSTSSTRSAPSPTWTCVVHTKSLTTLECLTYIH